MAKYVRRYAGTVFVPSVSGKLSADDDLGERGTAGHAVLKWEYLVMHLLENKIDLADQIALLFRNSSLESASICAFLLVSFFFVPAPRSEGSCVQ